MAQIAYLLLCHKDPERIAEQARRLTAMGDRVAIHFDASAPAAAFSDLRAALADESGVIFVRRRTCGWGAWSLVAASLDLLKEARRAFPAASHFYLISGDCMPIKPAHLIRRRLDETDRDWIEAAPFATSDFIKTGMREDRLIYRHWFNERDRPGLFYASYGLQKRLGLARALPEGVTVMVGSQWWCLRRRTVDRVLDWLKARPDVPRFFRTTWIPDETFFQTAVRNLVPSSEIEARTPTFLAFTDYGQPVTFHDDHYDLLLAEDALFARKIGPEALDLRRRLGELYAADVSALSGTRRLHRLHGYLTGQGRIGERFGARRWEAGGQIGEGRQLAVLVSKKWHVAKRIQAALAEHADWPGVAYVFDEAETDLPDLGGLGDTLERREAHRRAFLATLADILGTERLAICLDPRRLEVVGDLLTDAADVRVLDIDCTVSDDYLAGHAARVGLWDPDQPGGLADVLPTLRADVTRERRDLRRMAGDRLRTISETKPPGQNARALARCLDIETDCAARVIGGTELFAD